MRAVALLLVLVVAPIGPTICELSCAHAAAHPGEQASTAHESAGHHDAGALHHHDMDATADVQAEADASGPGVGSVAGSGCLPFAAATASAGGTESFRTLAIPTGELTGPFLLEPPAGVTGCLAHAAASPPPHSPPIVPLRI